MAANMNYIRRGAGKPLLLIHGLGGNWRSWNPILDGLAKEREVIAVDLPGFGETPPLSGEVSIRTLADSVTEFLRVNSLTGVDAVGSSMGARLVLELARRGAARSARSSRSTPVVSGAAGNDTFSTARSICQSASSACCNPSCRRSPEAHWGAPCCSRNSRRARGICRPR
jgi:pimeloyl-ACP methyl ester carboxylesterase